MKKLLMILLGAMLVLSMASTVVATGNIQEIKEIDFDPTEPDVFSVTSEAVEVSLALKQSFTIQIPADFSFSKDTSEQNLGHVAKAYVKADVYLLDQGKKLVVYVDSESYEEGQSGTRYWTLTGTQNQSKKLNYIMKTTAGEFDHVDYSADNQEQEWLTPETPVLTSDTQDGIADHITQYLHLRLKEGQELAVDTYTDNLKFTVKIEEI